MKATRKRKVNTEMCPVTGQEPGTFKTRVLGNVVFVQQWGLGFEKLPNTEDSGWYLHLGASDAI